MITMPPRHGKSLTASQLFPAWFLGRHPDRRIILASYQYGLAAEFSRRVRNMLEDQRYQNVFPGIRLAPDFRSSNAWDVRGDRGGMIAAGTRGGITGRGADLLIIDDPIKDLEEANSPGIREKVWGWYTATAYSRLAPGAAILLIATRWHADDLSGRLLAVKPDEYERVPWTQIRFPALSEQGAALWPAKYDVPALRDIQGTMADLMWQALYQGSPYSKTGALFKRSWFPIMETGPAQAKRVRFWDLAATEQIGKSDPDWTTGSKVSLADGVFHIEDIRRVRDTPLQVEALIKQTAQLDGRAVRIEMEQEPGASGVNTITRYRTLLAGYNFRGVRATGPKVERWAPMSSQAEGGNIRLVKGTWNQAFLDEADVAPNGVHDDTLDATVGAFESLLHGGIGFG